ncbi:MAG: 6-phosphogluconolactonase [Candidatus Dormibacteria bacterium]
MAQLCIGPREFHIVSAGGSTPSEMYKHLSREYKTEIDWSRWHVWFGDERAVAPDDEDSNYRMADVSLLRNVGIPENQVHRMPADDSNLADGASRYNTAVSETIPRRGVAFPSLVTARMTSMESGKLISSRYQASIAGCYSCEDGWKSR